MINKLAAVASTVATVLASAAGLTATAAASPVAPTGTQPSDVVFVQTDNLVHNQVVAYRRAADGHLSRLHVYATGGRGGQLQGSVVDHLASQGSLGYDPSQHLLVAVNAGSNTVTAFTVAGDRLTDRHVVSSGGRFPVSVTADGDHVVVLNALGGGSLQEFTARAGTLDRTGDGHRDLGLDPTATPQFTTTPGQVAFSPSGSQLLVTTKNNTDAVDVYGVGASGRLARQPTVTSLPGTVPFAVTFRGSRQVALAEAGPSAVRLLRLDVDGKLQGRSTVATDQAATCWIASAGGYLYAANAGSNSLSRIDVGAHDRLHLLGQTATAGGTVDVAATANGRWLYVQTGAKGIVDGYRVGAAGGLTPVGATTVPGAAGGEGIVAF